MSKLYGRQGPPPTGHRSPGQPGSKIGAVSLDRTKAQITEPATKTTESDLKTYVDTYFTKVPVVGKETPIIYNGDRTWARVTLTLETAGPVAVGNQATLAPVLSGKGQLLETDVPTVFFVAKGTRLYEGSTGINRIKRVIEPFPWLEPITGSLSSIDATLRSRAAPAATPGSKL